MKRIYKKYQSGKGFTLLEMLIVVAILVILMGITIVSLVSLRKNLRQKQLDYCAELIYMAAQNQLAELSVDVTNYTSVYGPAVADVTALKYTPADAKPITINNTKYPTDDSLYYVCSWTDGDNTAKKIVPSSVISAEIWNGNWVIEYAPNESFIYGVYYSETDEEDTGVKGYGTTSYGEYFKEKLRAREGRLTYGAQVGYYGGDVAVDYEYQVLEPHITVYNDETLVAYISCVSLDKKAVSFDVTVSDDEGHFAEVTNLVSTQIGSDRWVAVLTLDGLDKDADRFCNQFPTLTAGSNITISATASSQNRFIDEKTATADKLSDSEDGKLINSLYAYTVSNGTADNSGVTAYISSARHLQNLDKDAYLNGILPTEVTKSTVTQAIQLNDISFRDDEVDELNWFQEDWYTCYTGRRFDSIENSLLTLYNGQNYRIIGLQPAYSETNVGLFSTNGTELTIQNLTLSGTEIGSNTLKKAFPTNAGAVIGRVRSGKVTLSNVHVTLDTQTDLKTLDITTDWPAKTWLNGSYVGGLIGRVDTAGTVTISDCLAATVAGTDSASGKNVSTVAGGLIGYCEGQATISKSYADCYLAGKYTGALVGYTPANTNPRIILNNCYAAGYLRASTRAAGLVNGYIYSAANVYTAAWPLTLGTNESTYYSTAVKALAASDGVKRVYYLKSGTDGNNLDGSEGVKYNQLTGDATVGSDGKSLTTLLNTTENDKGETVDTGIFSESNTNTSVPYNLMQQGLISYAYPVLAGTAHYGDWYAEFEAGSLVYFEKYAASDYGFYGGNVNTLKSATVLDSKNQTVCGDGYGLVYYFPDGGTPVASANMWVSCGDQLVQITDADGKAISNVSEFIRMDDDYVVLVLPASITNNDDASSDFWQKLTFIEGSTDGTGGVTTDYYFNPHFAQQISQPVEDANGKTTAPDLPNTVYIRSARQLYNLSLYYDEYTNNRASNTYYTFDQSVSIDYTSYDWENYANTDEKIKSQNAIGLQADGSEVGFIDTYDGNCHSISGLSLNGARYTGLFAWNDGTLRNIVLANDCSYDKKTGYSGYTMSVDGTDYSGSMFAGALTAYNNGTVRNCSVAGYIVTVNAYYNSTLYAGGFVGYNNGNITGCSAVGPIMTLTVTESDICVGGFAGGNNNTINACYAITSLETTSIKNEYSKSVVLAGFCASNGPRLTNSYCATSFTITGAAEQYSFCPLPTANMTVSDCYYLQGGTFRFAGRTYTYSSKTGGGSPIGYQKLQSLKLSGFGTANVSNSYIHSCTTTMDSSETSFPFPASVTNSAGSPVHYGDWVISVTSSVAGVFYWEHEEGGDNDGYYISFVDDNTNLCTIHDDGGVITEYGYGYYTKSSSVSVALSMDGFSTPVSPADGSDSKVAQIAYNAKTNLEKLMPGYTFTPYVSGNDSGELYLTNTGRDGTWTLTITDSTNSANNKTETYTVCPFFGDAFMVDSLITEDSSLLPGNEGNPYLIRNVEQLQFINWNYSTDGCRTDVTSENYQQYPYLQYATVLQQGKQDSASVYKNRSFQYWEQSHDLESFDVIPTGDTEGGFYPIAGTKTGSEDDGGIFAYYGNYNAVLYTWFGGSFDGQSYKIINLGISSYLNNVGVFGYTCGAELKNIILYSDNSTVIKRVSDRTNKKTVRLYFKNIPYYDNGNDSYAIGSLVGIAYEYYTFDSNGNKQVRNSDDVKTISNCAVAGYTIEDKSQNQRISCGDVNIGGLFGICNANILNCSSVVDIIVDTTFEYYSYLGNTVRAGGIAGCCNYELRNCYSGGSISLGENARKAIDGTSGCVRPEKKTGFAVASIGDLRGDFYFTHYCLAGICAGNFGGNFMNFTNNGDITEESHIIPVWNMLQIFDTTVSQVFENCYTYMTIQEAEGDRDNGDSNYHGYNSDGENVNDMDNAIGKIGVDAVMAIGGVPELLNDDDSLLRGLYKYVEGGTTIRNCWYLDNCIIEPENYDSSETGISWADYSLGIRRLVNNTSTGVDKVEDSGSMTLLEMTSGSLQTRLDNTSITIGGVTYTGYAPVTTYENNGTQYVGSKYSFPGDDQTLLGTIYPYPSIITQTNSYGETVHVHYGKWTTGLLMFDQYYVTADLLQNERVITLNLTAQGDVDNSTPPTLIFRDEYGEKSTLVETYTVERDGDIWRYTIRPNGTGIIQITATAATTGTGTKVTAGCQVTVTGKIDIEALPADGKGGFDGYLGDTSTVQLTASYKDENDQPVNLIETKADNLHWSIDLTDAGDCLAFTKGTDGTVYDENTAARSMTDNIWGTQLDLKAEGDVSVTVTLQYALDGWKSDGTSDGPILTQEYIFAVHVWTPTVLGIANLEGSTPVYTELTHTTVAQDSYSATVVDSIGTAERATTIPQPEGSTLYLYYSGKGASLEEFLETHTLTVTTTNGSYTLEADEITNSTNSYTLDPDDIQQPTDSNYQLLPIKLYSTAGDFTLTFTSTKDVTYVANGVETTKENVTYGVTTTVTRNNATKLSVNFIGQLMDDKVVEEEIQLLSTPLEIDYGSAVTAAPTITLPSYYVYKENASWKNRTTGNALGELLYTDTDYVISLESHPYTFIFNYGTQEPVTIKYVYGRDNTIALFDELNFTLPLGDSFLYWTYDTIPAATLSIDNGESLTEIIDQLSALSPAPDLTQPIKLYAVTTTGTSQPNQSNGTAEATDEIADASDDPAEEVGNNTAESSASPDPAEDTEETETAEEAEVTENTENTENTETPVTTESESVNSEEESVPDTDSEETNPAGEE